MSIQSDQILRHAYSLLISGDPVGAKTLLEDALADDLENAEILFTVRCVNYWTDIITRLAHNEPTFEKGDKLIDHWKRFIKDLSNGTTPIFEQSLNVIRKGIFSLALENFQIFLDDRKPLLRAEAYRKVGLCYKQLGEYESALICLSESNSLIENTVITTEVASVLAEMADCYALCGQDNNAKVLFREAFFINANKIDLVFLESELILRLIEIVQKKGFREDVMKEWIPVYGVLYGVFNIKRQLKPQEVGKLKQTIYILENELKVPNSDPDLIIPKLINHYFWLIDHYVSSNDDRSKINETLLKIKVLDNDIHSKYTM